MTTSISTLAGVVEIDEQTGEFSSLRSEGFKLERIRSGALVLTSVKGTVLIIRAASRLQVEIRDGEGDG